MMSDEFILMLCNSFFSLQKDGHDEWCIINMRVPKKALYELYCKFIKEGVTPIGDLPLVEIEKYNKISCKYNSTQADIQKGAIAAYTLGLITSTD